MDGLAFGIVKENGDSEHPGMVKVALPSFAAGGEETFWARVTAPYAGKEYGAYLLPETDASVIVGFIGGDTCVPVVLGCYWNNINTFPAGAVTEKNEKKVMLTKGGNGILITDGDEGELTVKTMAGHRVSISDKDKIITVSTSDGKNTVTLDEGESIISVVSGDKLSIKAKDISIEGKMSLKGASIAVEADGELSLKGKTVKMEGNSTKISGQSLEAVGSASVKVESSAMLTLKGSITKIN